MMSVALDEGTTPRIPVTKQEIHITFNPPIVKRRRPILSMKMMTGMMHPRVMQLLAMTTVNGSSTPAA